MGFWEKVLWYYRLNFNFGFIYFLKDEFELYYLREFEGIFYVICILYKYEVFGIVVLGYFIIFWLLIGSCFLFYICCVENFCSFFMCGYVF